MGIQVLVSTKETQGQKKGDFSHATEGEIVVFGFECEGESIDGGCGCRRSLTGVKTLLGTTTFKVVQIPNLSIAGLTCLVFDSLLRSGYKSKKIPIEKTYKIASEDAGQLARIAASYPLGSVLERRGEKIIRRQW